MRRCIQGARHLLWTEPHGQPARLMDDVMQSGCGRQLTGNRVGESIEHIQDSRGL
jgi:hypothetical protein